MAINKYQIKFTEQEDAYLKTFLSRESFRIGRLPKKQQGDKENTVALKLGAKIGPDSIFNRVEIKILLRLIENFILIMRTMTLPEYDRRIAANPDQRAFYQKYIDKHEIELDLCEAMFKKVDGLL